MESTTVPAIYHQIFESCSADGRAVARAVLEALLGRADLPAKAGDRLRAALGPDKGPLDRPGFFRALALLALAQQGKELPLDHQPLITDLPIPVLGDLEAALETAKALRPCLSLGLSYRDVLAIDDISVDLVPEKRGLFLKYTEYSVTSRRHGSQVTRRYNDFVALNELLLARFPYRMVPRLPPKRIVSDAHFLEARRRGLLRWLSLVARHPSMAPEPLLAFFLRERGADVQQRMRDLFKRSPDEFASSEHAATAREELKGVDEADFAADRERIRQLIVAVERLKHLGENSAERAAGYAKDLCSLADHLAAIGLQKERRPEEAGRWPQVRAGLGVVAKEFQTVSSRALAHAHMQDAAVSDRLTLLHEVLLAHRDLCDRLEKGLTNDHQAALAKMLALKKRRIQCVTRGADSDSVEQLEARMMAQENIIANMEHRTAFSLYCVHMETQLVNLHLEVLAEVVNALVAVQICSHSELADIWKRIQPHVMQHLPAEDANGNK